MKNKISKLLISMGLLIIIGSLMLISYSKYVDNKALQSFEEKIEKKEVISKVWQIIFKKFIYNYTRIIL